MKKLLTALICSLLTSAYCSAQGNNFTADRHMKKNAQCTSCHKNGDTQRPVRKESCLDCHDSYETLAKRTEAVNPNPHYNHFGDRDCAACHKGHSASVVTCNQCHKFDLKTP